MSWNGGQCCRHEDVMENVWIGWCKYERLGEERSHADQSTCTHCNKLLQNTAMAQPEGQQAAHVETQPAVFVRPLAVKKEAVRYLICESKRELPPA